jgi:hypothetical protein
MASNLEIKIKLLTEGIADLLKLKKELGSVGDAASGISSGVDDAATSLGGLANAAKDSASSMVSAEGKAKALVSGYQAIADSAEETANKLQDAATAAGDAATAAEDAATAARKNADGLQAQADKATDAANSLTDAAQGAKELATALGDTDALDTADAMEQMAKTAQDVALGFQDEAGSARDAAKALEDKATSARNTAKEMQSIAEKASTTASGLRGVADGANAAATSAQTTGTRFGGLLSALSGAGGAFREFITGNNGAASSTSTTGGAIEGLKGKLSGLLGGLSGGKDAGLAFSKAIDLLPPGAGAAVSGLGKLEDGMKALIGAFVAFVALKSLKEMADYAARTETLGITLDIVAKNAGYTTEEIDKYEKALKKQGITSQVAAEAMTQMIQAGLPLGPQAGESASNVERLARASQDLAVVTGENSSETFKRLITNIQQMDTMGLRFMGITTDIEGAQDKYALSIGKTSQALSQQEKVLAVNIAVLKEADKLAGAYEASMETVGKKVQSLKRYQEELTDTMGKKLLPAYGEMVDEATHFLKSLEEIAAKTDVNKTLSKDFGEAIRRMSSELSEAGLALARFGSDNAGLFESMIAGGVNMVTTLVDLGNTIGTVLQDLGILDAISGELALAWAVLGDTLTLLSSMVKAAFGGIVNGIGIVITAVGELVSYLPGSMGMIGDSLKEVGLRWVEVGTNTVQQSMLMGKSLANSQSEVGKLIGVVQEAKYALSDFGKATSLKSLKEEMEGFADAASRGAMTSLDLSKAKKIVTDQTEKMIKSGKLNKEQLEELIEKAKETGIVLPEGFRTAEEAMKGTAKIAEKVKVEVDKIGTGSNIRELTAEARLLQRGIADGSISVDVASAKFLQLQSAQEKLAKTTTFTTQEVQEFKSAVGAVGNSVQEKWDEAMKGMGVSLGELQSGISGKTALMLASLVALSGSARTSAETFALVFNNALSQTKNVSELEKLNEAVVAARENAARLLDAGKIDESKKLLVATAEAAKLLSTKFDDAYAAQLKNVNSTADWERLKKSVVALGEAGVISATDVRLAMEKGEEAVRKLDPAYVAAANASKKLESASKDVDKQMSLLEGTTTKVASQAEAAYTAMAMGYGKLAGMVAVSAGDQIAAIDRRFNHESKLLDTVVGDTLSSEKKKTDLLISSTQEKIAVLQGAFDKQKLYIDQQVDAESKALNAKLNGYKTDEIKINESLGKQADKQKEYQAALRDLDEKRREAVSDHEVKVQEMKIGNLNKLKDSYQTHIDRLVGEEERLLGKIKDFAGQSEQIRMSAADKIRNSEIGLLDGVAKYEAQKTDITRMQSDARQALAEGNMEKYKSLISSIQGKESELNREVKDGEKILISKEQAQKNYADSVKTTAEIQQAAVAKEKEAAETQLKAVQAQIQATKEMRDAVLEMVAALKQAMGQKLELNIKANTEEARSKVEDLNKLLEGKESLMKVKVDLDAAQVALKKMEADIAAGRPFKVDADVTKAEAALKKLGASTTEPKVKADVAEALAAIEKTKTAIQNAGGKPIKVDTEISSVKSAAVAIKELGDIKPGAVVVTTDSSAIKKAYDEVSKLKDAFGTPIRTTTDVETSSIGRAQKEIIKLQDASGRTIYTNISTSTKGLDDATAKIEVLHATGRKEIIARVKADGTAELTNVGGVWDSVKAKIEKTAATAQIKASGKEELDAIDARQMKPKTITLTASGDGVEAIKNINTDTVNKTISITATGDGLNAVKNIDSTTVKKSIEIVATGNGIEAAKNINSDPVRKDIVITATGGGLEAAKNINSDTVEKKINITAEGNGLEAANNINSDTVDKKINISSNAADVLPVIEGVMSPKTTDSTHSIDTNASEANQEINQALQPGKAESSNNISTNADTVKGQIDEALTVKESTSTVSVKVAGVPEANSEIASVGDNAPQVNVPVTTGAKGAQVELGSIKGPGPVEVPVTTGASSAQADLDSIKGPPGVKIDVATGAGSAQKELDGIKAPEALEVAVTTGAASAQGELDGITAPEAISIPVSTGADAAQEELNDIIPPEDITVGVTTGADAAQEELDGITPPETVNIGVTTTASEAQGEITGITGTDVFAVAYADTEGAQSQISGLSDLTPVVDAEVNADTESAETQITGLSSETPQVTAKVTAPLDEAKTSLTELTATPPKLEAQVTADGGPAFAALQAQLSGQIDGSLVISANDDEVEAAKKRARKPTYSMHYMMSAGGFLGGGLAGLMGFAEGGPVLSAPPGPAGAPQHLSEGTIPGAGNQDSVHRTLDSGSFVIKKSAVAAHGADRLLDMITKAKAAPKQENAPAMGRIRALLMPGEIVVGKDTVSRIGINNLHAINKTSERNHIPMLPMRFADGGAVGGGASSFDFISPHINFGDFGFAFEKGGSVPTAPTPQVMQVDLRGNSSRATVMAGEDQSKALLNVLSELKARSV